MKLLTFIFSLLLINNTALALEGVKAICIEESKHGTRNGTYPFPIAFLQSGDSLALGSYIHVSERYMITVIPAISDLFQNSPSPHEIGDPGTYEVLLSQLPSHEKNPTSSEKVCHAVSVLVTGTDTAKLELEYHKKDDVGGFLSHSTHVNCEFTIIKI